MFTSPMPAIARLRGRLVRPEYTGENRCLPCTIVNGCLAAIGIVVLWQISSIVAVLFGIVAAGAILFRGYLVPGTPALTKRYLPDRILARFEHGHGAREADPVPFDVGGVLTDAGVLVDAGDDVALDPAFERRLAERVDVMDHDHPVADLAQLMDVEPERIELVARPDAIVVRVDGGWAGQWESRAALLTDLAANREMDVVVADWDGIPLSQRSELLGAIRACLSSCSVCGGDVELASEVVESCCRSMDVVAATCRGCDSRLFEVEWTQESIPE